MGHCKAQDIVLTFSPGKSMLCYCISKAIFLLLHCDKKMLETSIYGKPTIYKEGELLDAGDPEVSKAILAEEESLPGERRQINESQLLYSLYEQCLGKRNGGSNPATTSQGRLQEHEGRDFQGEEKKGA